MDDRHLQVVAREQKLATGQVRAVATLIADGATVPFIARYRKEATGSLDEVLIRQIRDRLELLAELERRRAAILASLTERELLTPELAEKLQAAATLTALEDLYLPYRPKRRTRATMARERGLEPLAHLLLAQDPATDPVAAARPYVAPDKGIASDTGVATVEEALQGARDIIAEEASENEAVRVAIRNLLRQQGRLTAKVIRGKQEEGAKFRDYFAWDEAANRAPSHRVLALGRGESEKVLRVHVTAPAEAALRILAEHVVVNDSPAAAEVATALAEAYKRLLAPSLENEIRLALKKWADAEAIGVFAENLGELLLAPPLGRKRVLALDPGFRTGCKLACLDRQGELLHHDTIYPHSGRGGAQAAAATVGDLVERFAIEAVAVGNGTAGRETEAFVNGLELPTAPPVVMVDESGASVYSASEVARQEFPDHDITVRGAVSIGRRLQDPLAELVKLDPKVIGVGQYQHDVDQSALRRSLEDTVVSCVNAIGVDVNTASEKLLTFVSGVGPRLAANIVARRNVEGPFRSRRQLQEVPRLGAKAFQQAAGFLRVNAAANPLDASAVHPESYPVVAAMARDLSCEVSDLLSDAALRQRVDLRRYVSDTVGLPTLSDIMQELARPGRDPRDRFEPFRFDTAVQSLGDLEVGMRLPGIVTNVTDFGAFVDVGVHQDGLAHISQLADRYIKHPSEVVKVRQHVMTTVIGVDIERQRISLSLKSQPDPD